MIQSLRIKNLALIEDLHWELTPGLNILTGETGAGKSILIDALGLLLGERADKSMVRTGEQSCAVETVIKLSPVLFNRMQPLLDNHGAEPCEDGVLLLKRSCTTAGANRQFINGSPVTLQALKAVGDILVDVHGPHDHQSLLQIERQLGILDAYAKIENLREEAGVLWEHARRLAEARDALQMSEREREEKMERLTHQVHEIDSAQLKPGEDETLENDYRVASHARQLLEYASSITGVVSENDSSVLGQLALVEKTLQAWERIDSGMAETAGLNRTAITHVKELLSNVQNAASHIDLDAQRLQSLDERMNLVQNLKRKYGSRIEQILEFGAEASRQLKAMASRDEELQRIEKEESEVLRKRDAVVVQLSAARRKAAEPLAGKIQQELRALGFGKATFCVDLTPVAPASKTGAERVEFIFTPNVGESPRPLRAIASSGEMARVMLAIKTTLAEVDEVPILIFDEVDANVGGETASQVGRKLRGLGRSHQVLCITHLPQVAACGNTHYRVVKDVKEGRTVAQLTELDTKARVREIARMLGGENEKSLALARKLVDGDGK